LLWIAEKGRTKVGPFRLEQSITLEDLEQICNRDAAEEALFPLSTALDDIPVLAVLDQDARNLRQGRAIDCTSSDIIHSDDWVLAKEGQQEVALCEMRGGQLWPKRVFVM